MTKEKIIDGVKVEECSYYNKDNTPYCCEVWDNECEAQNYYFKQLKRLEQENTRLKEKIIELSEEKGHLIVENNTLKEDNHRLLELDKYRQKELENKAEATKSNIHNLALLSKANKALQEIKEIAMGIMDDDIEESSAYSDARQIINLITKAEEE